MKAFTPAPGTMPLLQLAELLHSLVVPLTTASLLQPEIVAMPGVGDRRSHASAELAGAVVECDARNEPALALRSQLTLGGRDERVELLAFGPAVDRAPSRRQ